METKFNFKSQICTTREQSERLIALGLKKETADMTIVGVFIGTNEDGTLAFDDVPNAYPPILKKDIPAWSLGRLIEIVCNGQTIKGKICSDIIFDEVIECIEYEIKKGHFNKEYLEDKNNG